MNGCHWLSQCSENCSFSCVALCSAGSTATQPYIPNWFWISCQMNLIPNHSCRTTSLQLLADGADPRPGWTTCRIRGSLCFQDYSAVLFLLSLTTQRALALWGFCKTSAERSQGNNSRFTGHILGGCSSAPCRVLPPPTCCATTSLSLPNAPAGSPQMCSRQDRESRQERSRAARAHRAAPGCASPSPDQHKWVFVPPSFWAAHPSALP